MAEDRTRLMSLLVDDVGSFPLPSGVERKAFEGWYVSARSAIVEGKNRSSDSVAVENVRSVTLNSLRRKLRCGVDVVTYPQHYDMYRQFLEPIHETMKNGTYVVENDKAVLPELRVIADDAKELAEIIGGRIRLKVCITGPLELYLKEIGSTSYEDVLLMFAETVKRFAENSVLNSKWVETTVVSLDEPSFGFQEVSSSRAIIIGVLEKAFDFGGVTKQVHLHSSSGIGYFLDVDGIDVVSFEFGASPRNIESVSKRMLEGADKRIRVGVSRTDIDAIVAELRDKGISEPSVEQLVDSEDVIQKRFLVAREKFGETMSYTGPDCGLGGWPSQQAAELVLRRTVNAVKPVGTDH